MEALRDGEKRPVARCRDMPSSVIRRFSYDAATGGLAVEFVSGRRYLYRDVPGDVADSFRSAFAKGRFFNARIRDRYPCEPFDPDAETGT